MSISPCLVDGTFELFRAFYGAPSRLSSAGQDVAASISFGRSLLALARSERFTHFAVAFDTVIESFRNDLFEGYKTGEGIDPLLHAQFPLAERVARALGFCVLSMIEFEADDGLASAARIFEEDERVERVVVASPDKDLMQLVSGKVITWDRIRDKTYDEAGVIAKMGVRPESIPDYLALVGDSADGIPGVPRWGARSSALILSEYGHLERIPRHHEEWAVKIRGAASLAEQLQKHEQAVSLYRTLATLRRDVALGVTVSDMEYTGENEVELAALEVELGVGFSR